MDFRGSFDLIKADKTYLNLLFPVVLPRGIASLSNYQRMWDGLPEEKDAKENLNQTVEEHDALPARTGLHRNPWGALWKKTFKGGGEFYDWDGHGFHFVGGISLKEDGSMTLYRGKKSGDYLRQRGVFAGGLAGP